MKKLFLLALGISVALALSAQAPGITWQQVLGGTDVDAAHDIQATPDGGYVVAGSSDSQDGDVGAGNGDYDIWILKLDQNGTPEWKKNYGGSDWEWPNAVKPTSDGGYIVVGFTYSDDGDVSGFHDFRDGWVIKLSAIGNLEWQKPLGGSSAQTIQDVIEVSDGYLLAGYDNTSNDGDLQGMNCDSDFWIVKLGYSGNIIWQRCYGGSDTDLPNKIIPFGADKFLIAGYADSDDGVVTGQHGSRDFWVIAIDDAGAMLWQKSLGGSSWDEANSIVFIESQNKIVVVGESLSNDGDVSLNHGDLDMWMAVLDTDGNLVSEKSLGGSSEDKATSVLLLPSNELILSGAAASTDGDVHGNHGGGDMWVVKTDTDGSIIWDKSVGGSGYEQVLGSVLSTNDDGIILAGHTSSNDGDVSGLQGDDDLWIVKLGGTASAVNHVEYLSTDLKIYPNPASGASSIFVDPALEKADRLIVTNIFGETVLEKPLSNAGDPIEVSTQPLPSGSYFIEIFNQGKVQTGKFLKLD